MSKERGCSQCEGAGRIGDLDCGRLRKCYTCDGQGKVTVNEPQPAAPDIKKMVEGMRWRNLARELGQGHRSVYPESIHPRHFTFETQQQYDDAIDLHNKNLDTLAALATESAREVEEWKTNFSVLAKTAAEAAEDRDAAIARAEAAEAKLARSERLSDAVLEEVSASLTKAVARAAESNPPPTLDAEDVEFPLWAYERDSVWHTPRRDGGREGSSAINESQGPLICDRANAIIAALKLARSQRNDALRQRDSARRERDEARTERDCLARDNDGMSACYDALLLDNQELQERLLAENAALTQAGNAGTEQATRELVERIGQLEAERTALIAVVQQMANSNISVFADGACRSYYVHDDRVRAAAEALISKARSGSTT